MPIVGLVGLVASLVLIGWIFAQHLRRGWKDRLWIWREANHRALYFAVLFGIMTGGAWLRSGPNDKALVFAAAGLGFVAMPYLAYIVGRLLGILHRARRHHTQS